MSRKWDRRDFAVIDNDNVHRSVVVTFASGSVRLNAELLPCERHFKRKSGHVLAMPSMRFQGRLEGKD